MPNLNTYIDLARSHSHLASDNAVARALGLQHNAVNYWRNAKAWPSDVSMIALAKLAGVDPARALLDLNTWRAKSEAVRSHYLQIAAKISAAVLIVILGGTIVEQITTAHANSIHYALF